MFSSTKKRLVFALVLLVLVAPRLVCASVILGSSDASISASSTNSESSAEEENVPAQDTMKHAAFAAAVALSVEVDSTIQGVLFADGHFVVDQPSFIRMDCPFIQTRKLVFEMLRPPQTM